LLALLASVIFARPEPVLGGQKQIILGLEAAPPLVLSYFTWRRSKPNEFGSSTNEYTQRMGYLSAAVKSDVMNNSRVWRFEAEGHTKDPLKESDLGVAATETTWVAKDGHILRQVFEVQTPKGVARTVEAIYGTKTVELTITENGQERTATLYPTEGCQSFFDRFKPMVVDGKVVLKDKKFSILDPQTLGIVSCSATVGGRFNGKILLEPAKGTTYDITLGGKRQHVYLDERNHLLQIDITEDTFFQVDALPTEG